jgi:hypothetical protein
MIRFITIAVILLLAAAPLAAQTEPRFLIERIDVRNSTRSAEIVRAESRLEEGQSYTERELREASYRINRLPFVYDSTYSLEKGSRRDAYVFVVTITATKPLFYSADVDLFTDEQSDTSVVGDLNAVVGGRKFVGRRGVAHIAFGSREPLNRSYSSDYRTVEAGYTQYDLFGTRAFATLSVGLYLGDGGGDPSPSLLVGIPVSDNQTISARLNYTSSSGGIDDLTLYEHEARGGELTWTYNTTDHPFFPTRGLLLSAGYGYTASRFSYPISGPATPDVILTGYDYHDERLLLSVARYWQLSSRNTVWGQVDGLFARSAVDQDSTIGFARNLREKRSTVLGGDARLEASYQYVHYDSGINSSFPGIATTSTANRLNAGVVHRTAIGRLRLGMTYEW